MNRDRVRPSAAVSCRSGERAAAAQLAAETAREVEEMILGHPCQRSLRFVQDDWGICNTQRCGTPQAHAAPAVFDAVAGS